MARLSEMHRLIGDYLELKGDKDVTSIGSVHGSDVEYTLHLHDVHDGPPGTNPYSGADTLEIPKKKRGPDAGKGAPAGNGGDKNANEDTALPGTIGGRMVQMMLERQEAERAGREGGRDA